MLRYRTAAPLALLDTVETTAWAAAGRALVNEADPEIHRLARAVAAAGYAGWYGRAEILLAAPATLVWVGRMSVPRHVRSYGDPP